MIRQGVTHCETIGHALLPLAQLASGLMPAGTTQRSESRPVSEPKTERSDRETDEGFGDVDPEHPVD